MASIGQLAAGVAHELNNPLACVMANLELALDELTASGTISQSSIAGLADAQHAARRMKSTIRDLGLFSRSEDPQHDTVDVHDVLDATVRMVSNELRHRAHLVKAYGTVPLVEASDAKLGQVFLNLLVNAAQSIPPGDHDAHQILITTSTDDEGAATIAVSDTGAGIPLEVQKRLFTPFFTTKPRGAGTGLGLVICQRIISGFGGTLQYASELGKGTVFTVTLPAAAAGKEVSGKTLVAPVEPLPRARILIVDDEQLLVTGLARILGREHDVTTVTCGRDALAALETGARFDLILSDVMMPQMTGIDLFAAVAALGHGDEQRIAFNDGRHVHPDRARVPRAPRESLPRETLRGRGASALRRGHAAATLTRDGGAPRRSPASADS